VNVSDDSVNVSDESVNVSDDQKLPFAPCDVAESQGVGEGEKYANELA
jgi:hypothetical protein